MSSLKISRDMEEDKTLIDISKLTTKYEFRFVSVQLDVFKCFQIS